MKTWLHDWLYNRLIRPREPAPAGMLDGFDLQHMRNAPTLAALALGTALYFFAAQQWLMAALQMWLAYAGGFAALAWLQARRGVRPPSLLVFICMDLGVWFGSLAGCALWFVSIGSANLDWPSALRELPLPFIFGTITCGVPLLQKFIASERAIAQRAQLTLERQRQEAARQAAEAQLRLLQAQIEPHFLLNTLGNVRSLVKRDADRARIMLDHLVAYLHVALPRMRQHSSTLGHELELSSSYLAIMQIRMGERLSYRLDCPPELLAEPFPPMLLQTLVENAIKHGLEPSAEPGEVAVSARLDPDPDAAVPTLRITVTDTGVGFGKAATGGTGIGLANVRERLQSLYGEDAELIISPNSPSGVIATLVVPRVATPATTPSP